MIELIKIILELSNPLLNLTDIFRNEDSQTKADIAVILKRISDCLARIASQIRAGNHPGIECAQLITSAEDLPDIVQKLDNIKAKQLKYILESFPDYARKVYDLEKNDIAEIKRYLQGIDRAVVEFRALVDTLRMS